MWLIESKRETKAHRVLQKMSKSNGRNECWKKYEQENITVTISVITDTATVFNKDAVAVHSTNKACSIFKSIFTPKKNLVKASLLFYVWIALMLLYYGISLGVTNIGVFHYHFSSLCSNSLREFYERFQWSCDYIISLVVAGKMCYIGGVQSHLYLYVRIVYGFNKKYYANVSCLFWWYGIDGLASN